MKIIVVPLVTLALAGCMGDIPTGSIPEAQPVAADSQCAGQGLARGSDAYLRCREQFSGEHIALGENKPQVYDASLPEGPSVNYPRNQNCTIKGTLIACAPM